MIPPPDMAMAIDTITISFFGMVMNGGLLLLILSQEHLRTKDYICIILNRAALDFTYCLCVGIFQPWAILSASADTESVVCVIAGFIEVALGTATQYAEPVLACNRFIATIYNDLYKKIFRGTKKIILVCASVWLMGIVTTVPHLFTHSLGRVTGAFCCIRFDHNSLVVTILAQYVPLLTGETLIAFFNYKIYRSIHTHQKKSMSSSQQSRLQKDREMLYFIIVSAVVPLLTQFPAVVGTWLHMFRPDLASGWVMFFVLATFNLTPISDPVIAVLMVRPIKKAFVEFLVKCGILSKNSVVPTVSVNLASTVTVRTTLATPTKSGPGMVGGKKTSGLVNIG